MIVTYDYKLILLSVAVAVISSYAGLLLLNSHGIRAALNYKLRIGLSAFVIGTGIWSMHFIGMLALHLPIPVNYAVLPTLLSVLIAITLTGIGLYAATCGHLGEKGWMLGSLLMGGGIGAMHYVGMEAVKLACIVTYSELGAAFAIMFGVIASGIALKLVERRRMSPRKTIYASVVLGCAISLMHYTGMLSTQFAFDENAVALAVPALNETYLACIVAVSTFVLCEVALLMSLPSAQGRQSGCGLRDAVMELADTMTVLRAPPQPAGVSMNIQVGAVTTLYRRPIEEPEQPANLAPPASATPPPPASPPVFASPPLINEHARAHTTDEIEIPIGEADGTVRHSDILFVAADGHYSQIGFLEADGSFVSRFSKLSMTQVAELLDDSMFERVHRSYLVNISHVRDCRRSGGNGQVRFDVPGAPPVPVSRSRYRDVERRVAKQRQS